MRMAKIPAASQTTGSRSHSVTKTKTSARSTKSEIIEMGKQIFCGQKDELPSMAMAMAMVRM